ncbi:MAG: hypothetical protein EOO68_05945 [Moraxellaceae bacterium]|nr:MAG: hypothetical protein EOO68_05945 [Moraxellaceae bacterium]
MIFGAREALKNVGGDALARQIFQKKADDCTDAGGRATQEQLPSLHAVNEHFFGKFNDASASKIIFQRFLRANRNSATLFLVVVFVHQ